ncbi:hypothetical protein [Zavarzinella formosa]|uniref:hypothetical protein n=1 Tax=Zavarzinella formosa TaxID=360055 RepID=UPI0004982598|nr:hypothetical protein [Zavarzinella formosa]
METVIMSSQECPMVCRYALDLATALGRNLQIHAVIQQGMKGEFGVYVNGASLFQRSTDDLPSIQEVEEAVQREFLVGA